VAPGRSKTLTFTIPVQVARADYCFRVCLFSRDDVFQSLFRLKWIGQHQIVQSWNATRVRQCHFQVGAISPRAEIVRFQGAIRCRLRFASFCSAVIRFRARVFVVTRWGVSYLLRLNAVSPRVCRAAGVKLARRAKMFLQGRQHRLAAHWRLLSSRRE
jgi:hypothetical protein